MTRTLAAVLAVVLAAGACNSSTGSNPPPGSDTEDTFDQNSLSSYTGWSDVGGNWVIQGGSLVGSGPAIQSVLIRNGVSMTTGWVETVSSYADDGGLVVRFRNAGDYYLLAFRDDAAPSPRGQMNLALYHRNNGDYDEMWTKDVSWPRGTARTIRFQADPDGLSVFVDGVMQGQVFPNPAINDPFPYFGAGGVGVRNYGESGTWRTTFDSFRWNRSN